jgi:hypothetical protein
MKSLSVKRKLRIVFYIGFGVVIYITTVYGRDWHHISLGILYLAFIMAYGVICLKGKGEKECPGCTKKSEGQGEHVQILLLWISVFRRRWVGELRHEYTRKAFILRV